MAYVYELVDPRDGSTFYVGKGTGNRYSNHANWLETATIKNNRKLYFKIKKLNFLGLDILYNFPYQDKTDEEAFDLETELIDFHGLKNLCNLRGGGLGGGKGPAVGHKVTDATRKKISKALTGKRNPMQKGREDFYIYDSKSKKNPYVFRLDGKWIEVFPTLEQAIVYRDKYLKENKC